jgi:hypothetical protein
VGGAEKIILNFELRDFATEGIENTGRKTNKG